MITKNDISRMVVELRDEMIETDQGVSGFTLAQEFNVRYPNMQDALIGDLWWDFIHGKCKQLAKPPKSQQLTLPGIGDFSNIVTTYNGEGEPTYKRLTKASKSDLLNDEEFQRVNAESAARSYAEAVQRNQVLVPLMDRHNFGTAGDAIQWMAQQQAQP